VSGSLNVSDTVSVGFRVGATVILSDGVFVGCVVITSDGLPVGLVVITSLGRSLGDSVKISEGDAVGRIVTTSLGVPLGILVGGVVGIMISRIIVGLGVTTSLTTPSVGVNVAITALSSQQFKKMPRSVGQQSPINCNAEQAG
jgi:hypothetical protein